MYDVQRFEVIIHTQILIQFQSKQLILMFHPSRLFFQLSQIVSKPLFFHLIAL